MSTSLRSPLRTSRLRTSLVALIEGRPLPLRRLIPERRLAIGWAGILSGVAGVAV